MLISRDSSPFFELLCCQPEPRSSRLAVTCRHTSACGHSVAADITHCCEDGMLSATRKHVHERTVWQVVSLSAQPRSTSRNQSRSGLCVSPCPCTAKERVHARFVEQTASLCHALSPCAETRSVLEFFETAQSGCERPREICMLPTTMWEVPARSGRECHRSPQNTSSWTGSEAECRDAGCAGRAHSRARSFHAPSLKLCPSCVGGTCVVLRVRIACWSWSVKLWESANRSADIPCVGALP